MNLTPHFTLEELTHSDLAARRGIDNRPPADVLPCLITLARKLEEVRDALGAPLLVHSGYRSPAVNRAVGGSTMSAHCAGYAADFIAPAFGEPRQVAQALASSGIEFDQLIYEGTWVHISCDPQQRRHVLTAHFNGGPATYTQGVA